MDSSSPSSNDLLRQAVESRDGSACRRALQGGADQVHMARGGWDPLRAALALGSQACCSALAPERDVGEPLPGGGVLFDEALSLGRAGWLLEALDPLEPASDQWCRGWTPLMLACAHGLSECAQAILERSNPRARSAEGDQDALMLAASCGSLACVELLLKACDPHAVDRLGLDALRWALISGHLDCAQALAPFAIIDAPDREPLGRVAALSSDPDCIRLAHRLNPKAFSRPHHRQTPLAFALAQGLDSMEAIAMLADPRGLDGQGRPMLWAAVEADARVLVEQLVGLGADPDARGPDGSSCAMLAARAGRLGCLRAMLPKADLTALDPWGRDARGWAKPLPGRLGSVAAQSLILAELARRGAPSS